MLACIRRVQSNPRFAFLNLVMLTLLSLLVFIDGSGMLFRKQRDDRKDVITLHKRVIYYFWPSQRLEDKLKVRERIWQTVVSNVMEQKRERRFPDAIIIGAERCGTDGLAKLLQLHPLIKLTSPLDTRYFIAHYAKGPEYYRDAMPWVAENELVLESSPAYFSWPPMALPKRLKSFLPRAKIIVVLCNPVDRAFIDFNEEMKRYRLPKTSKYEIFLGTYLRKFSREKLARYEQWDEKIQSMIFDAFTDDYATHIITSGMYYHHAVRWKSEFGSDQLTFLNRDDMMKNTGETVEKLQRFLQIPLLLLKEDFKKDKNAPQHCFAPEWTAFAQLTDRRCPLAEETRSTATQTKACEESLRKFYAPFNMKLYKNFKQNFGW